MCKCEAQVCNSYIAIDIILLLGICFVLLFRHLHSVSLPSPLPPLISIGLHQKMDYILDMSNCEKCLCTVNHSLSMSRLTNCILLGYVNTTVKLLSQKCVKLLSQTRVILEILDYFLLFFLLFFLTVSLSSPHAVPIELYQKKDHSLYHL